MMGRDRDDALIQIHDARFDAGPIGFKVWVNNPGFLQGVVEHDGGVQ
jgi:hypothetical protein